LDRVTEQTERRNGRELIQAASIFLASLVYLWFLAKPAPWAGVVLAAAILRHWRSQSDTLVSLGLGWPHVACSFRRWATLWLVCTALFLYIGRNRLYDVRILERGAMYFVWCLIQQTVYQTIVYRSLRDNLRSRWVAAAVAGVAFSLVHAPNPILVGGTLIWGIASSLLFEVCPSAPALALLQVMLSSMLMWLTPYDLHHGFRIGPFY
jgi:hypothetical protein